MARHAQPRELAELKGANKKNPQRYQTETPKNNSPLGPPPPHLKAKAREVWFELEANCLPNVITAAERFLFEILSNLIAEYRRRPSAFPAAKYTHMVGLLARLGYSPADRQKLGVAKKGEETNPFAAFAKGAAVN